MGNATAGGSYGPVCGGPAGDLWYPVDHFGTKRFVTMSCLG